jgi:hypothetical protein
MYAKYGKFPVPKFVTPRVGESVDPNVKVTQQLDITSNKTQMMRSKNDTSGPRNFLIVPKLTRPKSVLIPSKKQVWFLFFSFAIHC